MSRDSKSPPAQQSQITVDNTSVREGDNAFAGLEDLPRDALLEEDLDVELLESVEQPLGKARRVAGREETLVRVYKGDLLVFVVGRNLLRM